MTEISRRLLYLTRHGETDWNAAGRWQGHTDVPINANGRAQALAVADTLRRAGIGAVASSDLSRAHETARIVAESLGVAVSYLDADLRERAFGVFEGLTREECERLYPQAWKAWREERRVPDGAEAEHLLAGRATAAIARAAERIARDGSPVLVVTHGGPLRAAVGLATGKIPGPIANGAIWRIEWAGQIVAAEEI
jgi:probable phosphoglycerate mutase